MKCVRASAWLACVYAAFLGCAPASGAQAFITDQTGDEVSVLDLKSKQVVARIPVLGKPTGIAMARDGRAAYVTTAPARSECFCAKRREFFGASRVGFGRREATRGSGEPLAA